MRQAIEKEKLNRVYNQVANHYDFQHAFFTGRSDQRGRRLVVHKAVRSGDNVLDCGAGTGSTSLLAAHKAGPSGRVTLFDMSDGMMSVAKEKMEAAGLLDRAKFRIGDMTDQPFEDGSFDVALSTYSMCPLYDPAKGAKELYRVVRPGGCIGIAHSTEPGTPWVKWLADRVEDVVWHIPSISLGCRSVTVLPTLEALGGRVVFKASIGVPLWPFTVFVIEKPAA